VTGFSILRLVIGASQRQARHTRNVMRSQPETVIVLAARATGFSLVSLSHTAFGSGDDQMSLTCRSCPDAPHLDLLLSKKVKALALATVAVRAGQRFSKFGRTPVMCPAEYASKLRSPIACCSITKTLGAISENFCLPHRTS
jgi:hypothetical protein